MYLNLILPFRSIERADKEDHYAGGAYDMNNNGELYYNMLNYL